MAINRQLVAAMAIPASVLVGVASKEGFREQAYQDSVGVWTVGFGTTVLPDGSRVKQGDRVDPIMALRYKLDHIEKDKNRLDQCVKAPVSRGEFESLLDHSYQYGRASTCSSGMVRHFNAGNYTQGCQVHLEYRKVRLNGVLFDCATPGNKICMGVWTRAQERYATCMGLDSIDLGVKG